MPIKPLFAALAAALAAPVLAETDEPEKVAASTAGLSLRSADGAYVLKLRGYVQADGRFAGYDGERAALDTFLLRRVRPILEGNAGKHLDFRIMTDFGGGTSSVQDAWLDVKLAPWFKVRAGKMKAPVGLERLQSGADLLFVERAHPTSLVPNRDVGFELHGDLERPRLTWSLGVFNGVPDGASADLDAGDAKDVAARVFVTPGGGVGIGIAATAGSQHGTAAAPGLPTYRTPAQVGFFSYRTDVVADGDRRRLVPQASWYRGRLGALGEYALSRHEVSRAGTAAGLENEAWQIAASFVLTGEAASFGGVSPREPFDPGAGGWGAVEAKLRYSVLAVDEDAFPLFADPAASARTSTTWGGGVTWTLTRHLKTYLDYEQTSFEGGAAGRDREDEKAILTRLQVSF